MQKVELSVIVPFYNEEKNLPVLHKNLLKVLKSLKVSSEIIYINDGSTDLSIETLKAEIRKINSGGVGVVLVEFTKNFGQTAAVVAGIDHANGKYISFLDADLQNDPEDINKFFDEINKDYDAVFGWRKDRLDATFRSFLSKLANLLINLVFSYPYHDVGCSAES